MSSALATLLTPRIKTRSLPRSMTPPPALSTFWPMISASSPKVMPAFVSDSGFGQDDELALIATAAVHLRHARHVRRKGFTM
jgi:hypothetical protein